MQRSILLLGFLTATACGSNSTSTPDPDAGSTNPIDSGTPTNNDAGTSDTGTSDSGAATWAQTTFGGANIVPAVVVDPKNPARVFIGIAAGSVEKGFFRSKDGGKSWEKIKGTLPDQYAGAIAINPRDGTLVANPGVEGLWRSIDGGDNWNRVAADPGGTNSLLFHPSTNTAWTVTSQQGCFRSDNNGETWARTLNTDLPLNQFGLGPLAYDGTKLYLGTDGQGVYVSTNNGDSWTKAASANLVGRAENVIATPSRPGVLFVQTRASGIFRSTDSGATFTKLTPGGAGSAYPALRFDPTNAKTIYVSMNETQGGPGGLAKSTDDGDSWVPFGPSTVPISAVDIASDGAIFAGTIGQGVWRFGN